MTRHFGIKGSPNVSDSYPKRRHISLCIKLMLFEIAQRSAIICATCNKICHQESSKISQSGHHGGVYHVGNCCKEERTSSINS